MTAIDAHGGKPEFAGANLSLVGADSPMPEAVDTAGLPDPVARIWDRLEIRDRSMIVCLEAIVRSVRINGTAFVGEVVSRYVDARAHEEQRPGAARGSDDPFADAEAIRTDLLESVLPRLAGAELISLPTGGLRAPDAVIEISNPLLRLALLESGLIKLDQGSELPSKLAQRSSIGRGLIGKDITAKQQNDWAQVWFAIQRYSWSTLAVVPASPGDSGLAAATALVAAGRMYQEGSVHLVDATGAAPGSVDLIIASISGARPESSQLILALDSPLSNPASIPLARYAGVALLAVALGEPSLDESRRTVDSIGRQYFVGSVALKPAVR